jgi:hypothetical protein
MSIQGFEYPKAGLGNVASYQVSGIPWVTSSLTAPASSSVPLEINFPSVTKSILVKNINPTTNKIRVGFSANGVKGTNYLLIEKDESFEADVKITKLYLLSDTSGSAIASVVASLTGIDTSSLPNSWSGSSGVG